MRYLSKNCHFNAERIAAKCPPMVHKVFKISERYCPYSRPVTARAPATESDFDKVAAMFVHMVPPMHEVDAPVVLNNDDAAPLDDAASIYDSDDDSNNLPIANADDIDTDHNESMLDSDESDDEDDDNYDMWSESDEGICVDDSDIDDVDFDNEQAEESDDDMFADEHAFDSDGGYASERNWGDESDSDDEMVDDNAERESDDEPEFDDEYESDDESDDESPNDMDVLESELDYMFNYQKRTFNIYKAIRIDGTCVSDAELKEINTKLNTYYQRHTKLNTPKQILRRFYFMQHESAKLDTESRADVYQVFWKWDLLYGVSVPSYIVNASLEIALTPNMYKHVKSENLTLASLRDVMCTDNGYLLCDHTEQMEIEMWRDQHHVFTSSDAETKTYVVKQQPARDISDTDLFTPQNNEMYMEPVSMSKVLHTPFALDASVLSSKNAIVYNTKTFSAIHTNVVVSNYKIENRMTNYFKLYY